jgi:hypothetical protein
MSIVNNFILKKYCFINWKALLLRRIIWLKIGVRNCIPSRALSIKLVNIFETYVFCVILWVFEQKKTHFKSYFKVGFDNKEVYELISLVKQNKTISSKTTAGFIKIRYFCFNYQCIWFLIIIITIIKLNGSKG